MVIPNHGASDNGFIPFVLQTHFGYRNIKLTMQTRDERLDSSALFFERNASREVEVDGEGGEQGEFLIPRQSQYKFTIYDASTGSAQVLDFRECKFDQRQDSFRYSKRFLQVFQHILRGRGVLQVGLPC